MANPAVELHGLEAALVLAADDAQALAAFYAALTQGSAVAGFSASHWRVLLPQAGWLEIYQPSRSRPQPRQRGRLAVCLRRQGDAASLERWLEQAVDLGAQRLDSPRDEAFGRELWLLDPEGNGVLLLVSGS